MFMFWRQMPVEFKRAFAAIIRKSNTDWIGIGIDKDFFDIRPLARYFFGDREYFLEFSIGDPGECTIYRFYRLTQDEIGIIWVNDGYGRESKVFTAGGACVFMLDGDAGTDEDVRDFETLVGGMSEAGTDELEVFGFRLGNCSLEQCKEYLKVK